MLTDWQGLKHLPMRQLRTLSLPRASLSRYMGIYEGKTIGELLVHLPFAMPPPAGAAHCQSNQRADGQARRLRNRPDPERYVATCLCPGIRPRHRLGIRNCIPRVAMVREKGTCEAAGEGPVVVPCQPAE